MTDLIKESNQIWASAIKRRTQAWLKYGPAREMSPWTINDHVTLWHLFPPVYSCPRTIERVGSLGDGGKYVCAFTHLAENRNRPCVVYSFGISNEISFEE